MRSALHVRDLKSIDLVEIDEKVRQIVDKIEIYDNLQYNVFHNDIKTIDNIRFSETMWVSPLRVLTM